MRRGAAAAADSSPQRKFGFVQFDFAGPLGLPEGRWVVRDSGAPSPSHVLIVDQLAAPAKLRRKKVEQAPDPAELQITRVTVIDTLSELPDTPPSAVTDAAALVQRALTLAALASPLSPGAIELPSPVGIRTGFGSGAEVADSGWSEVSEVPLTAPSRRRRRAAQPNEETFSALLGGRVGIPVSALITLRARRDLDSGRIREAAIQLEAAINTARTELGGLVPPDSLESLVAHAVAVAAAAEAARAGDLDPEGEEVVATALARLETAQRQALRG
ncbi:MAG: hypothetical protein NTY57_07505 [Solirubrobacterales bacterium]|nr:hypothetical protein [Solirubrobacterales bacterium]